MMQVPIGEEVVVQVHHEVGAEVELVVMEQMEIIVHVIIKMEQNIGMFHVKPMENM